MTRLQAATVLAAMRRHFRTSEAIAAALGESLGAVRAHITRLWHAGLVERADAPRFGGRPVYLWRTTETR